LFILLIKSFIFIKKSSAFNVIFLQESSVGRGPFSLASTYVSPQLIVGAFALSIVVGLIAGAVPTYGASKLKPVDALRYE